MEENSLASVAQRVDTTQDNKHRTLEEKLIQLGANDCPVSGAPEKTLGRILPSTSSASGWKWRDPMLSSKQKPTIKDKGQGL